MACADAPTAGPWSQPATALAQTAPSSATPFAFLSPIGAQLSFVGTFDPTQAPVVEVCRVTDKLATACDGAPVARYTTADGSVVVYPDQQLYRANWPTTGLPAGSTYRITVSLDGVEFGRAHAKVPSSGETAQQVAAAGYIALGNASQLAIRFRIELPPDVPAASPDTVPPGFFDDSAFVSGTATGYVRFRRGTVTILFRKGTPADARQRVVASILGKVVGGKRVFDRTDGFYYVRVATDGSLGALLDVVDRLDSLPEVEFASRFEVVRGEGAYLKPRDGAGWDTWNPEPSQADGDNWSLEAVAAPLAWGCSTGDSTATVGVADYGIRDTSEIHQNVVNIRAVSTPLGDHGLRVASVLAAVGNDGAGLTGMMWRAALDLQDLTADPDRPGQM